MSDVEEKTNSSDLATKLGGTMSLRYVATRTTMVAILGAGLLLLPHTASGSGAPEFRYPMAANHLLLAYSAHSGFPYLGEPHVGLKVYGDGRAVATLPEHYPNAALERRGAELHRRGYFETRLTSQEIQEILEDVEVALLVDVLQTRRLKAEQYPGQGYTDSALLKLRVNLDDYRPAGRQWIGPVAAIIEWPSPAIEAKKYPLIDGILAIDDACRAAEAWMLRIAMRVDVEEQGR